MNVERRLFRCECGCYATPQSIYLTDEKSMMFVCFCVSCEKLIKVFYSISEMFKECPKPDFTAEKLNEVVGKEIARITNEAGRPLTPPLAQKWTAEDKIIAHSLGIKEEEND